MGQVAMGQVAMDQVAMGQAVMDQAVGHGSRHGTGLGILAHGRRHARLPGGKATDRECRRRLIGPGIFSSGAVGPSTLGGKEAPAAAGRDIFQAVVARWLFPLCRWLLE